MPANVRADVDASALQPAGATAQLLGRPDRRRIGDWANPQLVGAEHAMGFMQFLPSTWRTESAAAPGGPRDPYCPLDAMVAARAYLLLQVASALRGGDTTVALSQVVASTRLGGLGKTQLAVELVHRYGRYFAGGVFWLSFASADEIPLQVAACAGSGAVGLETDLSSRPLEEQVKLVRGAWQSATPRLLVFDNCEAESLMEAWRPTSGRLPCAGHVAALALVDDAGRHGSAPGPAPAAGQHRAPPGWLAAVASALAPLLVGSCIDTLTAKCPPLAHLSPIAEVDQT